ncbi:MAG: helix-turn-helix domain-containing protein [Gammaproteobacteria bacterium]
MRSIFSCRSCAVRHVCLPAGLGTESLERLHSVTPRPSSLERAHHLFRPGEDLQALYVVKSGSLKVYKPLADGDEQIVGFHFPGELIGLDGLAGNRHACAATALETTAVCEFPITQLHGMCRQYPPMRQELNRLMGNHLKHLREMLLLVGRKSAEGRLAGFLLDLSDRLLARGLSPHQFYLSMSRLDIANHLGLAVETVSRVFSRFQDEGLLSVQLRHLSIHDPHRLRALVSTGTDIVGPFRPRAPSPGARSLPAQR